MALFEALKFMADNNMDIRRYDTLHSADILNKGRDGKIAMCTEAGAVMKLGGIVGKQTHIPILFLIDADQYAAVERILAEKG